MLNRCMSAVSYGSKTYWRRVAAGLCTACGERPPHRGHRLCLPCSIVHAARQRARYAVLKAKGICGYCRRHRRYKHYGVCRTCYKKVSRRRIQREAVWKVG